MSLDTSAFLGSIYSRRLLSIGIAQRRSLANFSGSRFSPVIFKRVAPLLPPSTPLRNCAVRSALEAADEYLRACTRNRLPIRTCRRRQIRGLSISGVDRSRAPAWCDERIRRRRRCISLETAIYARHTRCTVVSGMPGVYKSQVSMRA